MYRGAVIRKKNSWIPRGAYCSGKYYPRWTLQGHFKVTFTFLNGIPYFPPHWVAIDFKTSSANYAVESLKVV